MSNETSDPRSTKNDACKWTHDGDSMWDTECGQAFLFECDGPLENGMKFCCYCGKKLSASQTPMFNEFEDEGLDGDEDDLDSWAREIAND